MPPRSRNLHPVPDVDSTESTAPAPTEPAQAPAKPRPKTIVAAAADGSQLELLIALRSRIAKTIQSPKCSARDMAALSRQLREIAKEIDALEAVDREDSITGAASTPDEPWNSEAI